MIIRKLRIDELPRLAELNEYNDLEVMIEDNAARIKNGNILLLNMMVETKKAPIKAIFFEKTDFAY